MFIIIKILNYRQVHWSEKLSVYNFVISYQKRSENKKANAFNRKSDYFQKKKKVKHSILQQKPNNNLEYNHAILIAIF